ncbi:hypothetical protein V6N11_055015 [Hibiscus sabdariffa]|uniref:Expansin-like EG45 domain-containing protein n=1 Tax=Hibiscus sabdariffa TaxID=183260 RepID=A0ABR2P3Q1_9ROSI
MEKTALIFVGIVACLASVAEPLLPQRQELPHFIQIMFVTSACFGSTPQDNMIAAAGDSLWNNGAVCGKTFTVTCTGPRNAVPHSCTGKSVTVKIVDHCPGCPSIIDLSRKAFAIIADPVAGIINIDYTQYA